MPLNIIIAGAGIAGGAAAIALLNYGHQVTIYERRAHGDEPGTNSAIQLQPNGVRVLKQINALAAVDAVAYNSSYTDFRQYEDGQTLGLVDYNRRGGVRLATREQMKDALTREAAVRGATVVTGVGVKSVKEFSDHVEVYLTDGSTTTADLVVGADGSYSKVRKSLFPSYSPTVLPVVVYQVQVPENLIHTTPQTGSMDRNKGAFQFWPSPGRAATATPIPNLKLYDIQTVDGREPLSVDPHPDKRLGWVSGDMPRLRKNWSDHDPEFRAVLDAADRYYKWRLVEVRGVPQWHSPQGHVVCIGDANHAMKPMAGQGSAMAIEDGAVLAEVLADADKSTDLKSRLKLFEQIRRPRCELIQRFADELEKGWTATDPKIIKRVKMSFGLMAKLDGYENAVPDKRAPFHTMAFQKWLDLYDARDEVQKALQSTGADEPRARL